MMPAEIKSSWVAALRSGQYAQGLLCLRRGTDAYCCLGVLCDLYHKVHVNSAWLYMESLRRYDFAVDRLDAVNVTFSSLPTPVVEWSAVAPDEESRLVCRSVRHRYNFNRIADWIEVNL